MKKTLLQLTADGDGEMEPHRNAAGWGWFLVCAKVMYGFGKQARAHLKENVSHMCG